MTNVKELDGSLGPVTMEIRYINAVSAGLSSATGSVYYLKDALGSVTDIVNGSGNVVQSYQYSGFGKLASIKNGSGVEVTANAPVKTSFKFTGRELDQETGLYYYRARYYDPGIGRFLQQDPDPGQLRSPSTVINRCIYAQNTPTAFTDPSGRFPWLVIAIVSFAITAYQNNQHGGNFAAQFALNFAFSSLAYLIGVGLGGAEYSTAATWSQSAWTATQSLAISSGVKVVAWEAQDRGIASDGTVYALAFFTGAYDHYDSPNFSWEATRTAIGNTLTFPPVPTGSDQVPKVDPNGGSQNEN